MNAHSDVERMWILSCYIVMRHSTNTCLDEMRKTTKDSVRLTFLRTEFRTLDLPKTRGKVGKWGKGSHCSLRVDWNRFYITANYKVRKIFL